MSKTPKFMILIYMRQFTFNFQSLGIVLQFSLGGKKRILK